MRKNFTSLNGSADEPISIRSTRRWAFRLASTERQAVRFAGERVIRKILPGFYAVSADLSETCAGESFKVPSMIDALIEIRARNRFAA
jgi:hypothetical protein